MGVGHLSIMHPLSFLQHVLDLCKAPSQPVDCCFLDLKAARDGCKIRCSGQSSLVLACMLPCSGAVQSLYHDSRFAVAVSGGKCLSKPFCTGVKEGCPLSLKVSVGVTCHGRPQATANGSHCRRIRRILHLLLPVHWAIEFAESGCLSLDRQLRSLVVSFYKAACRNSNKCAAVIRAIIQVVLLDTTHTCFIAVCLQARLVQLSL